MADGYELEIFYEILLANEESAVFGVDFVSCYFPEFILPFITG
jgi:hypothetical protein